MGLIYLTGVSGSGKSTTRHELARRGHRAYDTDEDGFATWICRRSGEPARRPNESAARTAAWLAEHDWVLSRPKVEELVAGAGDSTVFLCGATSNQRELHDLFALIVCLTVGADCVARRLVTRTTNDFGRSPDELAAVLRWHERFEEEHRSRGAVMVDGTQPVEQVADQVLAAARNLG